MKKIFIVLLGFLNILKAEIQLEKIKLPPGFKIQVYAKNIPGARSMAWGANGILYVGTRAKDSVFAVDKNKKVYVLAKNLNSPNGVAYLNGDLYIAEIHQIVKLPQIDLRLSNPPEPIVVVKDLPSDTHHGWKFIAFGPDGLLYIPQGAPCNICDKEEPYASIMTVDLKSMQKTVYAKGVRNSVGFDWHPLTKELWFTDNGRDYLGDDSPADELNRAPKRGLHFGFPYCHAGKVVDPDFGKNKSCASYQAPVQELGPHVAALGMRFYTKDMFPAEYRNQIFIAEHGSWNRSSPVGYRLTVAKIDKNNKSLGYEVFAEGWLQKTKPWGRPVDILVVPDGSILVSDDYAGAIYQISYQKNR